MKLYKYTKINNYFYDMLDKEYMYCADPNQFDDIFDGTLPFELNYTKDDSVSFEETSKLLQEECNYFVSKRNVDKESLIQDLKKVIQNKNLSNVVQHNLNQHDDEIEKLNKISKETYDLFHEPNNFVLF